MPTLSIITIHRNDFLALQHTQASIQGCLKAGDVEWIVVDGASDWSAQQPQLKDVQAQATIFISEPDGGIFDAMNKGLAQASGRFCFFLNAGDLLLLDDVTALLHQPACAQADVLLFAAQEGLRPACARVKKTRSLSALWYGMPTHHQAVLFSTDACRRAGGYDTRYQLAADYALLCRLWRDGARGLCLESTLCHFDLHGVSSRNHRLGLDEEHAVRANILKINPVFNRLIYATKCSIRIIRKSLPRLYGWLRYRPAAVIKF